MNGLYQRVWPVQDAKAAVVVVHGFGEHSGRYEHVATALNTAGYAVYAQDAKGHGRSPGFPGKFGTDARAFVDDLVGLCGRVEAAHSSMFLLGHSVGALLAVGAAPEVPSRVLSGIVVSAIPLEAGSGLIEAMADPRGLKIPSELLSRDVEVGKAYDNDELVIHDPLPADRLTTLLSLTEIADRAVPLIRVPALVLHGGGDRIADPMGSRRLTTNLIVTDKTMKIYPDLYHEILNEPERDQVLSDIVSWLDERS